MTAAAKTRVAEFKRSRTEFRRRMRKKLQNASSSQLFDAIVSAGIVTKEGKLTAAYRE